MQTLVALYETYEMGQRVIEALVEAGIPRANIEITGGAMMDTAGMTTTTTTTTTNRDDDGIGGFFNRLFGMDIPEDDVNVYAESVRRGDYAVTVTVDDEYASRAQDIMNGYDVVDIDTRSTYLRDEGFTSYDRSAPVYSETEVTADRAKFRTLAAGENAKLEVVQEDLTVGKRAVEGGGVRVRQYITERPVSASVNLREEHVTVTRNTVDRAATEADLNTMTEGTIEVTEMAEEAVIGKTARVIEEVTIGKEATERTETVTDTVRRKDVEVENMDTTMRSTTTTTDVDTTRRNN